MNTFQPAETSTALYFRFVSLFSIFTVFYFHCFLFSTVLFSISTVFTNYCTVRFFIK
jgi:hypothetical protein